MIDKTKEHEVDRSVLVDSDRPDLNMIWVKRRFRDPKGNEVHSRICLAEGQKVRVKFEFHYSSQLSNVGEHVWNEILSSLQLEMYVDDPTAGDPIH